MSQKVFYNIKAIDGITYFNNLVTVNPSEIFCIGTAAWSGVWIPLYEHMNEQEMDEYEAGISKFLAKKINMQISKL